MQVRDIQESTIVVRDEGDEANSAVSWAAIIAGAFVAAAVMLILLLLGSGLGFAAVSPWANSGVSVTTFSVTAAVWLIVTQWIASALSGYLTGRLRTKWSGVDPDEIFFRDTAHGFLAWALATLFTVGLLASVAGAIISGGVTAVTAVTAGAAVGASQSATQNSDDIPGSITTYVVDTLFRADPSNQQYPMSPSINVPPNTAIAPDTSETSGTIEPPMTPLNDRTFTTTPSTTVSRNDARDETLAILINGVKNGSFPDTDRAYIARLIASRTGVSMEEATKRVDDAISQIAITETKIRQAADTARKTASTVSIFSFLSLLIGAFTACAAAALGGRHRDEY